MPKRHINEFLRTGFRNSGRVAGHGMVEDDYSEESNGDDMIRYSRGTSFNHKMDIKNGPVTKYKLSEKELEEYRGILKEEDNE